MAHKSFHIMSHNNIDIKKRTKKAAKFLIITPILKVPQAMRAANLSISF
jgi:hypothetical protein